MSLTPESAIRALQAGEGDASLQAVRFIKNSVIGNNTKKKLYLEANVHIKLNELLLRFPAVSDDLAIQALSTLGSFASGTRALASLVLSDKAVLQGVLSCLVWTNPKVVAAATRTVNLFSKWPSADTEAIYEPQPRGSDNDVVVQHLISFVKEATEPLAPLAASIFARTCRSKAHQDILLKNGIIAPLEHMLTLSSSKSCEAALDALNSVTLDNKRTCHELVRGQMSSRSTSNNLDRVYRFLKDRRPRIRLLAASCIANIYRSRILDHSDEADLPTTVLPTVIKLVSTSDVAIQSQATIVLAHLVEADERMQKAACDADAVTRLAPLIGIHQKSSPGSSNTTATTSVLGSSSTTTGTGSSSSSGAPKTDAEEQAIVVTANALAALAAVCADREDSRQVVIEARVLPRLISLLSHEDTRVRVMACRCARSLSRSVRNLRTSLVDAGIAPPLLALLSDESADVRIYATATLCNIVLEFSPMKKSVVEGGAVARLVELTTAMEDGLRLNATWALKNLLYVSEPPLKAAVMKDLTWERLFTLMNDEVGDIQEQAITLLRNLVCGSEPEIAQVFDDAGAELLPAVEKKLADPRSAIHLQALYVVCNLATGSDEHKHDVMTETVLKKILDHMSSSFANIRVAAIWCVINLLWREVDDAMETDSPTPGTQQLAHRAGLLTRCGIYDKLVGMVHDTNPEVRTRVDVALKLFSNPYLNKS